MRRFTIVTPDLRDVERRWRSQYDHHGGDYRLADGQTVAEVTRALRAMKKPTKKAIDEIMGNESWTSIFCSGCGIYTQRAVSFGDGYDSPTLCAPCLEGGLAALRGRDLTAGKPARGR